MGGQVWVWVALFSVSPRLTLSGSGAEVSGLLIGAQALPSRSADHRGRALPS